MTYPVLGRLKQMEVTRSLPSSLRPLAPSEVFFGATATREKLYSRRTVWTHTMEAGGYVGAARSSSGIGGQRWTSKTGALERYG